MKSDSHMQRARTTIQGKLGTCSLSNCKWSSLVILSSLVKFPTNLSVISFQNTRSASPKLSVKLLQWLYTTSQQLTACLNEFVSGGKLIVWNILSCFIMYVSVSNLHFPQMKLASEKPPEAVTEGTFPGGACPQTRLDHGKGRHPSSCIANWTYRFFLLPTALSFDICWGNIGYCLPVCETKGYHTS